MNSKQFQEVATLIAAQAQEVVDRNADDIIKFYNKDSTVKFRLSVLLADDGGRVDVTTKLGGQLQKLKDEAAGTVDPPEQGQLFERGSKKPKKKSKKAEGSEE